MSAKRNGAGSDRQLEGDGSWLADANGRGTGEVDSEVTSILWLTAHRADDRPGVRGRCWRAVRSAHLELDPVLGLTHTEPASPSY